ncbi:MULTISPECIES: SDR family oxidoreductase [Nostocales]|uniref:SDR family oxidoreductase n=3 Tax=Nostocales TaxID=1161 RepID=A0A8S9SXZ5_9CYAN|nr:SDR family oxidoreductase [Tolypothrix bouteillei]KAF3884254.1 SDR family oxidoreductase [Tolypothrix bouteillei VB521301]
MTQLLDKVVWITGASSGIGEALTYEIARQGAKIILSSRRERELHRVKNHCPGESDNYKVLPLDLTKAETWKSSAEQAESFFGRVDILINNGGISQRSLASKTSIEIEREIMEVNFFSAIALTKYILPGMIARQSGHIIAISSLVGKFGTPFRSTYAASKHALHGYFDSLRAEVWQENIQVTLICPGYIQTNVSLNALTETGDKYNIMDKNQAEGLPASQCAKAIVKAIQLNKEEIYIGGKEIAGVYLKRLFPNLLSKIVRRIQP